MLQRAKGQWNKEYSLQDFENRPPFSSDEDLSVLPLHGLLLQSPTCTPHKLTL